MCAHCAAAALLASWSIFSGAPIHLCNMTHSHVWRNSFICVTWLIHMCDMTHPCVWHDWFIWVTWRIHMCDMTHSYAWHDSFICVTWLIHMRDITHSCAWHDSFICVVWIFHTYAMTHSYVCHDSQKHGWLCVASPLVPPFICVTRLIHMHDIVCVRVCGCVCVRVWFWKLTHADAVVGLYTGMYTQI